eukprot:CAMPEP_0181485590 /NCGR_PEP_ID=MMETSP1110-20121109/46655_1 /TAXON_ID=174948 /ORGANISM="Symbiodinium sp., Strain CCMP421" /LENGTH=183 /DNA_ID=CAMNT_0023611617 /DNA_START=260 /DNA_END=807 /DNA_ORIENTATION=+
MTTAAACSSPDIGGLVLALPLVVFLVIRHLVTFLYAAIAVRQCSDMREQVLAAIVWLNEAEALVAVPAHHGAHLLARLVALGLGLRRSSLAISMPRTTAVTTPFSMGCSSFPPLRANLRELAGRAELHFRRSVFALAVVPFLRVEHEVALLDAALAVLEVRDVAKHVLAIVLGLNEAKSLLVV